MVAFLTGVLEKVVAGVITYYVCKWVDRLIKKKW